MQKAGRMNLALGGAPVQILHAELPAKAASAGACWRLHVRAAYANYGANQLPLLRVTQGSPSAARVADVTLIDGGVYWLQGGLVTVEVLSVVDDPVAGGLTGPNVDLMMHLQTVDSIPSHPFPEYVGNLWTLNVGFATRPLPVGARSVRLEVSNALAGGQMVPSNLVPPGSFFTFYSFGRRLVYRAEQLVVAAHPLPGEVRVHDANAIATAIGTTQYRLIYGIAL